MNSGNGVNAVQHLGGGGGGTGGSGGIAGDTNNDGGSGGAGAYFYEEKTGKMKRMPIAYQWAGCLNHDSHD